MIQYATVFLIIALMAAIFGVGALAVGASEVAELLILAFVGLFIGGLVGTVFGRTGEWPEEAEAEPQRATGEPAAHSRRHQ